MASPARRNREGENEAASSKGRVAARLTELGLTIPQIAVPVANYVPFVQTGNLIFVSGQLPKGADGFIALGKVGKEVDMEKAQACAKQCALNILAVASLAAHGDLDRIRVVKVNVFVASDADFYAQPTVANGTSDLFASVFGDAGKHARAAVSVPSLPFNVPVEVDCVLSLEA